MTKSRSTVKKFIYRFFGEKVYQRAYARGKIKDIRSGNNLEQEAQLLKHFIQPESTVFDIGANYGHYTVLMAKLAAKGLVCSFEPVPFTFGVLKRVVSHFNLDRVKLFHKAVSDRAGSVTITIPLLDFGAPNTGVAHISDSSSENAVTVAVDTIALDEVPVSGSVDFIKIDIEGHEPVAFKGMEKLIRQHEPVILIEFSHPCLKRAGFEPAFFSAYLMQQLGYRFMQKKENKLIPVAEKDPADGYYFLIPGSKMNRFKAIIGS
ncbi:MAG: FkbM family methyltransferase [Bacteroidetes bacterium]|nr:FkbM family methyltransferase [Bacteroidota bacterium]